MLVLVPPMYTPQNIILTETGTMGFLFHLIVITQDTPWYRHPVRITQSLFWVALHLVLGMAMVKVVWILGPPTLTTRKLIVGLMVAIFCHPRVGNTHTWVIHANIGPIIHKILLGSIIVVMMVRVEVMLLLGPTTYTPKNIMLAYTGMIGGLFHISVSAQHP